jgi:hypothetical protein
VAVFRRRNISRGNTKFLYGYSDDFFNFLDAPDFPKLFVIHMLLLSSFQTLAFSITTEDVSTPGDTPKVINLDINDSSSLLEFAIVHDDALDSEKFILEGDGGNLIPYTLTLKATALVQDKPYRVKVRATLTTETID